MDTSSIPEELQRQRAEVRWPVTLLTPHGPIDGETEYISLSRVLVVSKTSLPSEGDIGLLIKAPNHEALHMTSEVVSTTVNDSDDSVSCFGVELQLTNISEVDREFLCKIIANQHQDKIVHSTQREKTISEVPAAENTSPNSEPETSDVQLPAFYNKGGKTVTAKATRISPKGCLVFTKKPHRIGTVFSLKITNPKSNKSIQVDGSVFFSKHFASDKRWGMSIRFINLTEKDWEELRQVLADSGQAPRTSIKSKYLDTFKGFVLNKLPKEGRFAR